MADEGIKRKLTAILSADVAGYSRLMGEDEIATIETLKRYREIMATLINNYRGRVVDSPGDNILAEFRSAVDAVECAVIIQEELRIRNTELSKHRKMQFRMGINVGEVIEDEGRIYGNGINVAARIESLAESGGICIAKIAYEQVKGVIDIGYESIGKKRLKNIDEEVEVYRIQLVDSPVDSNVISEKAIETRKNRFSITREKIYCCATICQHEFYARARVSL